MYIVQQRQFCQNKSSLHTYVLDFPSSALKSFVPDCDASLRRVAASVLTWARRFVEREEGTLSFMTVAVC